MAMYEPTQNEIDAVFTGNVIEFEPYYIEYEELTFSQIKGNEEVVKAIYDEAYSRKAFDWIHVTKETDSINEACTALKDKVWIDKERILEETEDYLKQLNKMNDTGVNRELLKRFMNAIYYESKRINEPYYRCYMNNYRGNKSGFTFRIRCYYQNPHEVDYDAESEWNPRFWFRECVDYGINLYKKVKDASEMPFISSEELNYAKEYFLKFLGDAKTTAKRAIESVKERAIENAKEKVRRR